MHTHAKIRWGILGAARINQQLMPAISHATNGELIAIASRRPGAAAATLAQYAPQLSQIRQYDAPEHLLQDADIQAVYIPLSSKDHAYWTLRAIEQGKHVLCEKPLALTVADIDAIAQAAQQHQVTVMEGFMYRFHPQHQRVQAIIDSGAIGSVQSARTCFAYPMQSGRLYRVSDSIDNGCGAMWDIGCYAIHTARWLFANQAAQAISLMSHYNPHQADISSSGTIDFGNGRYAQISFGFGHARRAEYEIIGTQGGIKCHNVWAKADETPVISWWTDNGEQATEQLGVANHFQLEVEHFNQCLLQTNTPKLSLEDARHNCQVIVAGLQSAQQQRVMRIS